MRTLSLFQKKPKLSKIASPTITKIIIAITIASLSGSLTVAQTAHADRFDDQINSLTQQNQQSTAKQQSLQTQEQDLTAAIKDLETNIATIESQIGKNRSENQQLERKIAEAHQEIERQRQLLKVNVRQLYLDDQMSTIEKLASSKSIGDFVDKEEYRIAVQNKIKTTTENIETLQHEQRNQKAKIEKLLQDQQAMQGQLTAQKAESVRLRALNQHQQAGYTAQISENNERITQLQREQAEENRRHRLEAIRAAEAAAEAAKNNAAAAASPAANHNKAHSALRYVPGGNYPYTHHPFPNTIVDPWGMYTRQCVSYTAWKVAQSGRHMPYWGGYGNANQWDDNARAAGIPVDYNPRVGDIAVSNAGYYGHVMYVEAVYSDGTIYVSDYNANWTGEYSEYRRSTTGLVFIHF